MVYDRSRTASREDWDAGWIWFEGDANAANSYLYARKAFKLPAKPAQARLRIAANNRYKLYVNGNYVGRGPVTDSTRPRYDTYDISALLSKGANAIAVFAHYASTMSRSNAPTRPGIICDADIEWSGGSDRIITDETWRVLPADAYTAVAARDRKAGAHELYDASLKVDKWTEASFRDTRWPQAKVIAKASEPPFSRPIPQQVTRPIEEVIYPASILSACDCPGLPEGIELPDVPKLMATEALKALKSGQLDKPERLLSDKDEAATVKAPQGGGVSIILDFGQEVFGCVELDVEKSGGGVIDIGYDIFEEEGEAEEGQSSYRADRVILSKGQETWISHEPRLFRYIQMDIRDCPRPVSITRLVVHNATYPIERKGRFESSDQVLTKAWNAAAGMLHHRLGEVYAGRPRPERIVWWDEPGVAAEAAYYVFGDATLFAQELREVASYQYRDGGILPPYPSRMRSPAPDFGALWVTSIWDYFVQSGDKGLLSDLYPAVVRWLKWMGRRMNGDLLKASGKADLYIDWGQVDLYGEAAVLNFLYLGALRAAWSMADALARQSEAEEWERLAAGLRIAAVKYFWSPKRGLFADVRVDGRMQDHFSAATNILAALFDIADHYQKSSIYRQLLDDGGLPVTAPYFLSLLLKSLCRSGYNFEALDFIRRKWGSEDSASGQAVPLALASQLPSHFLGVNATGDPGRVRVEPHPGDIERIKGVVPGAGGLVSAEWRVDRRGFAITVDVPEGVKAEIVPPRQTLLSRVRFNGKDVHDQTVEVGRGTHSLQVLRESMSMMIRRKPPVIEEVEEPQPAPIPPGRGDIETVEQMIQILTQLEREQPVATAVETEEEPQQLAKRKRSRRRSKSHREAQTEETTAQTEPVEEEATEAAVDETVAPLPEPVSERPAPKRRRRRSSAKPVETQPEVAPESDPTQEAETNGKEPRKPVSRRRKRDSDVEAIEAAAVEDQ